MNAPTPADAARIYIDIIGDLLHPGHVRHLEKAKALGNVLVVGVFDDDIAAELSHVPVMNRDERVAMLAALRCVDEVVPAAPLCPDTGFLEKYDIAQICLCDDFGHPARQEALADLLEDGIGIVLPYTEEVSTRDIVNRITGIDPSQLAAEHKGETAVVHPPASTPEQELRHMLQDIRQTQSGIAEAISILSAARFKRNWLLDRQRLGDANWLAFLKCLARNEIERQRQKPVDPRFVAALSSMTERVSTSGDRINLVGAAAHLVAPVLAGLGRRVTVVRPGMTPPGGTGGLHPDQYEIVHCGWAELPDACPPSDTMTVMDPAASAVLLMDEELLFATTRRLKRNFLLAVDLAPEDGSSYSPRASDNQFIFTDVFVRKVFHANNFFEVRDVMRTVDGVPRPDGARGCDRISPVSMVDEDKHGGSFRYLDGNPAASSGSPEEGAYLRWYHASVLPIEISTG